MTVAVVIIADRPLGTAISRVLELFSITSVSISRSLIDDLAANRIPWEWPLDSRSVKDLLYGCQLVFAFDSERRGGADLIGLLHILRARWLGDARFVVLLHSESERSQFLDSDLFGNLDGTFSFRKMAGHSSLLLPLRLTDLLREIQLSKVHEGRMSAETWKLDCANQAAGVKVAANLNALRKMNWEKQSPEALMAAAALVQHFNAARWDSQVFPKDHRKGPVLAAQFRDQFPASRILKIDDLAVFCDKVDEILNESVFSSLIS